MSVLCLATVCSAIFNLPLLNPISLITVIFHNIQLIKIDKKPAE